MKQAIILAAGKGTRMLPLTKTIPKPLVNINGRPFITYLLDNLNEAGFTKVFLVVGYLKEQIESYFENHNYDFEIETIEQEEMLGTGHALNITKEYVKGEFAVINGDNLYSVNDLKEMPFGDNYNYIYALEHIHPEKFGVVIKEGDFLIELIEKPANPKSNLINSGLYKFTPEIFDALSKIERSERGEYELTSAIHLLSENKRVKVKEVEYWQDLGKIEDIPLMESFVKKHF